jgi:hypothetical protein
MRVHRACAPLPTCSGSVHFFRGVGWAVISDLATDVPLSAEDGLRFGDLALLGVDNALGELAGVRILPGA